MVDNTNQRETGLIDRLKEVEFVQRFVNYLRAGKERHGHDVPRRESKARKVFNFLMKLTAFAVCMAALAFMSQPYIVPIRHRMVEQYCNTRGQTAIPPLDQVKQMEVPWTYLPLIPLTLAAIFILRFCLKSRANEPVPLEAADENANVDIAADVPEALIPTTSALVDLN